ncbi:MAG: LEA type 2 family protein [Gammaproteobacteria bacterium]|nr:LEA type 2 family protein [Gammaproteobacteria bacterium]MDH3428657.1 LEA type 2 family protein [Gammaproteobacteria bacterium]MDH3433331.1 LEA type 2 family protein [Gammaproteobacteria bacterium]
MKSTHIIGIRSFVVFVAVMVLSACTAMRPGYETPTVTVNSFRSLPSEGALPSFEIGLHVINPNSTPLNLRGVAYTISLEGHDLIKGVGNELPIIDAYGQGQFTVIASASLFAGIRLITDLMSGPRESFKYELEAKLDIGAFRPAIYVRDRGEISLSGSSRETRSTEL